MSFGVAWQTCPSRDVVVRWGTDSLPACSQASQAVRTLPAAD